MSRSSSGGANGAMSISRGRTASPPLALTGRFKPLEGARVISQYEDEDGSPALVERRLGAGKVLLFTTRLSPKLDGAKAVDQLLVQFVRPGAHGCHLRYLAGDSVIPDWNFQCAIPLPSRSPRWRRT